MSKVIVLVDDNEDIRDVVRELLASVDLKVEAFATVDKATKYLAQHSQNVSAVLSDLIMINSDGIDFLAYIRKTPSLSHLEFYLLTGADVSVFKTLLKPYRVDGIISKPFNLDAFMLMFQRRSLAA